MKREYKLILASFATIAIFDAVSSVASWKFDFNYLYMAAVSYLIYGTFGFLGTVDSTIGKGVKIATLAGLFDAIAGWAISILLKANTGDIPNDPTPASIFSAMIFVSIFAAFCGLVGGGIAVALKKHKRAEIVAPYDETK